MPLQWRNQLWQRLEEGAGKRCSECDSSPHPKPPSLFGTLPAKSATVCQLRRPLEGANFFPLLRAAVHRRCQRPRKGLDTTQFASAFLKTLPELVTSVTEGAPFFLSFLLLLLLCGLLAAVHRCCQRPLKGLGTTLRHLSSKLCHNWLRQ